MPPRNDFWGGIISCASTWGHLGILQISRDADQSRVLSGGKPYTDHFCQLL